MCQTKTYACPAKGESVVLTQQILRGIGGIGDVGDSEQVDHDCSRASDCMYRTQPACIMYRLNGTGE